MSVTYVPHPYQRKSIATCMTSNYQALFLDPGLGKTSIMLRTFFNLKRRGQVKAMLVVAPLRPCYTVWPKESKKWLFSRGLKTEILHGPDKLAALNRKADIYVVNPEGLDWLFNTALKGKRNFPFDMLVIDESGKFKNPSSRRLKLLKPKLKNFKRRYILNGTPAPNGFMDLWGQFLLVDEGHLFGSKITHFRNSYFHKTGYMGREWKITPPMAGEKPTEERILKRAAKICLVMQAKDHLDMPPLLMNDIFIQLPKKARLHYEEIERELFTEIDDNALEIVSSAVASMSCRQVASGGIYKPQIEGEKPIPSHRREWHSMHNEKDNALADLVEELQGKPLLIAYEFHHDLVRIREVFKKRFNYDIPHIGAGVSPKAGQVLEEKWNSNKLLALAAQPASIAHGCNLQESRCEDMVWYTPTWNHEWYQQFIQRVWRQGMKGTQFRVHHLIAENTVDEVVVARRSEKGRLEGNMKQALIRYRRKGLN